MKYTIHREQLYVVEADSVAEALQTYYSGEDRPPSSAFHIPVEATTVYVTDENGEEI